MESGKKRASTEFYSKIAREFSVVGSGCYHDTLNSSHLVKWHYNDYLINITSMEKISVDSTHRYFLKINK